MPSTKERACGTKIQYTTRHRARNVARKFRNNANPLLEPYRCRYCKFYHIGHSTPRQTQPIVEATP